MSFYRFILGLLTVWRITHLLQVEDGPWDIVVRLRKTAGDGFWGKLLDCFYCLSLWVAAPLAYLVPETRMERWLWWPALSAGAILVERLTTPRGDHAPASYVEDNLLASEAFVDKENLNVMLRAEESTTTRPV